MRHLCHFLVVALPLAGCSRDSASSGSAASSPASPDAAAAATAAASPTAPSAAAHGACTLPGSWTGVYPPGPYPFSGQPVGVTFAADGTGNTESARANDKIAWRVDGATFTLHGITESGGRYACRKDQEGKYGISFSPDCASVTFKMTDEPCKGREYAMNGNTFKRK
jgi:hypothetical protein